MTYHLQSLDEIHQACWRELALAARHRKHPLRMMGLATVNHDEAELRSVVIREVSVEERTLVFFTDARSPKVAQIQRHPGASLLAWSEPLTWQLRLRVRLEVETSGLAVSSRWAHLKMTPAALDYLSPLPPGAPVASAHCVPERSSRAHFAVVTAQVLSLDWLELHPDGHRRAVFDAAGQGQWVVP